MRTRSIVLSAVIAALSGCGGSGDQALRLPPGVWPDTLAVEHPVRLPASLPALRVPLGELNEQKPNAIALPSGETLLVDYAGSNDGTGYQENLYFYRSDDSGQTWGSRITGPMGREGYFSITQSGVLFLTAQVLAADYRNPYGYAYKVVYRSADGGNTWDSGTPVLHADVGGSYATLAGRNVLELRDGSLLWEVGSEYIGQRAWRSYDAGLTWAKSGVDQSDPVGFDRVPSYGNWSDEIVLANDGTDVIGFVRCFPDSLPPIPNDPLPGAYPLPAASGDGTVNDEENRMVIFRSHDAGATWELDKAPFPVKYGEMYPNLLQLDAQHELFTFTIRALQAQVGVRVALSTSDLTHDVVEIDSYANDGLEDPAGGGYGNTIRQSDGTMLTPYSYRDAAGYHVETVRWQLPL